MGREDWWYVNLPVETAETIDHILAKEGKKYAIYDKKELVRILVRDFILKYEELHGMIALRKAVRRPDGSDGMSAL